MRSGHDCLRLGGGILFTIGETDKSFSPVFFTHGEKRFRAFGQEPPPRKPKQTHKHPANDPPRRKPVRNLVVALPKPVNVVVDLSVVLLSLDLVSRM